MTVTTDAVVWIEIGLAVKLSEDASVSPLMQWCGLKSHDPAPFSRVAPSPLMQWCGLKSPTAQLLAVVALVTTDAVVWIEMFVILLAE